MVLIMGTNIVIFNDRMPPHYGGMETHFLYFKSFFSKNKNWQCKYVISKKNEKHQVFSIKLKLLYEFNNISELIEFLKKNEIKVYFFNNGYWIEDFHNLRKNNENVIFCLRTGGNDFVKASLSMNISLKERQNFWAYQINTYLDFIISNSKYTNSRLIEQGILKSKIKLLRGGVDIKKTRLNIKNRAINRNKFFEKYSIKKSYVICTSARLVKFKGINFIIDAINKSKNKSNLFFLLIGDGPELDILKKMCEINLNPNSWKFIGAQSHDDALKLISISDIYISASIEHVEPSVLGTYIHTETMGRSLLEAMSQNIKIIATDVGGVKEWFLENSSLSRLLVKENDVSQIAKSIDKLLPITDIQQSFEKYSWDNIFSQYMICWSNILEKQ